MEEKICIGRLLRWLAFCMHSAIHGVDLAYNVPVLAAHERWFKVTKCETCGLTSGAKYNPPKPTVHSHVQKSFCGDNMAGPFQVVSTRTSFKIYSLMMLLCSRTTATLDKYQVEWKTCTHSFWRSVFLAVAQSVESRWDVLLAFCSGLAAFQLP